MTLVAPSCTVGILWLPWNAGRLLAYQTFAHLIPSAEPTSPRA